MISGPEFDHRIECPGILHWISASKFLVSSGVFLRDLAQSSRPKRYQKKYLVVFDIKISATRLKLRQEKSFL